MKKNQTKQLARLIAGELKPKRVRVMIGGFKAGKVDGYSKDSYTLSFYFNSAEEAAEIRLSLVCNDIVFVLRD